VVLGSLWIKAEDRARHKAAIRDLRQTYQVHSEFKWTKVATGKLPFYLDLIQLFLHESDMRFRCLVLPADQLDAATFHQADNELMFYKFYYLMLHGWILNFNAYRIFLDTKTNRVQNRLNTLQEVLNNANLSSHVSCVQALPSREVDLLQLADLLIGATGYRFHDLESSPAKLHVLNELEAGLGRRISPTGRGEHKFNVFQFRPGGGW